uniref:Bromo domain-containing protein n=1 Tax=Ditylenchus dipsaci TaxID=166011 RepID=A0A915ENJ4_9BILA
MVNEPCAAGPSMSYNNSNLLSSSPKQTLNTHPQNVFDDQSNSELLIHIQLFLAANGFHGPANLLKQDIEHKELVPKRYNIAGSPCSQTYENYLNTFGPFAGNFEQMVKKLNELITQTIPPVIPNLPVRLFASKRQSLVRTKECFNQVHCVDEIFSRHPAIKALEKAPITSVGCKKLCFALHFSGHSGEIADIAISPENTMLASGSVDKTVRVWCLQRGSTLMVYKGHTALLTSISFIPYLKGDVRYLVSASNDCSVVFFRYNAKTKDFGEPPIKFNERSRPGVKIISSCHSPGGNLVVMGDTHQYIRIYKVSDTGVERLYELQAHTDRVDSLVWAHQSIRFLSGSKDGVAKVWSIKSSGWSSVELNPYPNNSFQPPSVSVNRYPRLVMNGRGGYTMGFTTPQAANPNSQAKKNSYKVTMLCWSLADDIVLLKVLDGHINECFALLAHPIHKELCISAGHDGLLIVWNVYDGKILKKHSNKTDVQESASILDLAISPDGSMVVFVDNSGNTSILGIGSNQKAKSLPRKQFFSNDYMPLTMDQAGYVLDENTGLAPHNMDTPEFVCSDGIPHQKEFQRMIPGNDLINAPIARTCPWIQRQIIPALSISELHKIKSTNCVVSQQEADKIEKALKNVNKVMDEIPLSARQLVAKKQRGTDSAQRRRTHIQEVLDRTLNRPANMPRYIIPREEDKTDEDDSSYAGDDEIPAARFSDEEDDENATTNSTDNSTSSASTSNVAEENDSDYEVKLECLGRKHGAIDGFPQKKCIDSDWKKKKHNNQKMQAQLKHPVNKFAALGIASTSRSARTPRRDPKLAREKQRRRALISSEEEASPDPEQPSTSSASTKTSKPKPKPAKPLIQKTVEASPSTKEIQSLNTSKRRRATNTNTLSGFPTWLRMKERKRFPYVAQLGDEVVYFIQGHRKYIEGLEKTKALKAVPASMQPRTDLDATEFCIVDGVKYISKPIQLTCLKLSCLKNGVRTGVIIEIKHNDLEDVPDFLILKQHYDISVGYNFKSGDKVETLLSDHYYIGTVQKRAALDEDYPTSEWCSVVVLWNNDETDNDKYCPWDLQPMARGRKAGNLESIASQEEIESWGEYAPQSGDWPLPSSLSQSEQSPQEAQNIYLARAKLAISQIMQRPKAVDFKEPVDLTYYTTYVDLVDYPIDLQTIDERICNKYYRRSLSLLQDVQYLARNAVSFNRFDSEIAFTSQCLVSAIFRFLRDSSVESAGDLFEELLENKNRDSLVEWDEQLKAPGMSSLPALTHFESMETESGEEAMQLSAVRKKSVLDSNSPAKWIADCKEMANALFASINFMESAEMLNFCASRPSLQNIVDHIEKLESPQSFIESLGEFFSDFKTFIEDDHGGRRSRMYQDILKVEAQLQSKSKPIYAKFRLMNEEAKKAAASLFEEPKKRAAALCARELLKVRLAPTTKKYDQLLQQSQDKRYNTRPNNHNFDESSPNEYFEEDDFFNEQQPCSSKSIIPSTSSLTNSSSQPKSVTPRPKNVIKPKSVANSLKKEEENSASDQHTNSGTFDSNKEVDSEKMPTGDTPVQQTSPASEIKEEENGILEMVDAPSSANGYHKFEDSSEGGDSSGEEYESNKGRSGRILWICFSTKAKKISRLRINRRNSFEQNEEASFSNQSAASSSTPSHSSASSFEIGSRNSSSKNKSRKRKLARASQNLKKGKRVKICEDSFNSVASTSQNQSSRSSLGRPLRRVSTMKHMPGSYEEPEGSEEDENYTMPPTTTTRTGRTVKANSKYN